ncbi:MAG: hypothetical protein ACTHNH_05220 [Mesorhizobium sp.]
MAFEADPDFIKTLDSVKLVKLMKRLLLAECRLTGIPLRAASVPLQVTVADGGEDGRVKWAGGSASTAYFPHRFTLFQSKAQDLSDSKLRNEILKKRKGGAFTLSEGISTVLDEGGSYIVFCSHPFVESKKTKLVKAIRKAIRDGGEDPDKAQSIEIYDANKIADWVNAHPGVALWLASEQRLRSLVGFQTHEGWGKAASIQKVPWVAPQAPRYVPVNRTVPDSERKAAKVNAWTYEQAKVVCLDALDGTERKIRVVGPSGFGKSRFVYEILNEGPTVAEQSLTRSVIYADYSMVGDEALKLALEIADYGAQVTLVVDECPDQVHYKLVEFVDRDGSELRLITVDVETKFVQVAGLLTVKLERVDDSTIEAIAKSAAPGLKQSDTRLIAELANGFPQMAVLGAQQNADSRDTIVSVEQVLDRVIWGDKPRNEDAQRALEALSLFEWIGFRDQAAGEAKFIAEQLAGVSQERFVDLVLEFEKRGVLDVRGNFIQVIPVPLAARLGIARLGKLSQGTLNSFFTAAPEGVKASLLARMRWFDTSKTAVDFAGALLDVDGIGNFAALNTEFGAKCFSRLVHVDPDRAMATIDRVLAPLSNDELKAIRDGRTYLVWALEKLVFRHQTFDRAARLLLRFAAADSEESTASNHFMQLFQLHLSGTEADPAARLWVLDEGLSSSDAAEREVCFAALENMLKTGHFTRGGGSEEIGSGPHLQDWQPATYGQSWDFYREGLKRLTTYAVSDGPFSAPARRAIARHIRGLLSDLPFADLRAAIDRITAHVVFWPDAIEAVSAWLYFDARHAEPKYAAEVRAYFDELLPKDAVERVVVYTNGWAADLHDPDSRYDPSPDAKHDFEYSAREAVKLAPRIASDPDATKQLLDALCCSDAKSTFAFARELALSASDPLDLFKQALARLDSETATVNAQFFGGLIAGTDSRDPTMARACIKAAMQSAKLKDYAISMIGSGTLTAADLSMVAELVENGDVEPWACVSLSYGQRLKHLSFEDIRPALRALRKKRAPGLWAALEIIFMYLYGGRQPASGLVKELKSILTSADLIKGVNRAAMDGHHFQGAVSLIAKHSALDAAFAVSMVKQIVRLATRAGSDVFFALDDPARAVLKQIMASRPSEAWSVLSEALEAEDGNRRRLDRLLDHDRDDWLGPGLFYELPADMYLKWIQADPEQRASKAISWLPIAEKQHDGTLQWHPALVQFIADFGDQPNVLRGLTRRLHPSSWSGSLASYLEPVVPMAASWQRHQNPNVRAWAGATVDWLRRSIDSDGSEYDEPYR